MEGQNLDNKTGFVESEPADLIESKPVTHVINDDLQVEGTKQNDRPLHADTLSDSEFKATVTFIDPLETKWLLPYEACKTWEGVLNIITDMFRQYGYPDYLIDTLQGKSSSGNPEFSIKMIESGEYYGKKIQRAHWENIVKPGSVMTVSFTGIYDAADLILDKREPLLHYRNDIGKQPASGGDVSGKVVSGKDGSGEDDSKPKPRSYLVQYYEQREHSASILLKEESYPEPPELDKGKTNQGILEIITQVFVPQGVWHKRLHPAQLNDSDRVGYPVLRINSSMLRNALKDIIKTTSPQRSGLDFTSFNEYGPVRPPKSQSDLDKGEFMFPYEDLYHYKDELSAYMKSSLGAREFHSSEYNQKCDEHIQLLIDYLYEQPLIGLRDAENLWSQEVPKVRFHSVWLLLKPGSTVYVRDSFGINAYIIDKVEGGSYAVRSRNGDRDFKVVVWNLEYDGKFMRRTRRVVNIPIFGGEREISSLPLFPAKFLQDDGKYQELVERGKKYITSVIEPTFHEYSGSSHFYGTRVFNQVRVVVDHISRPWDTEIDENLTHLSTIHRPGASTGSMLDEDYERNFPNVRKAQDDDGIGRRSRTCACECVECQKLSSGQRRLERQLHDDYKNIELSRQTSLTDHQYLICFSHVYGFLLKDRIWDLLDVSGLRSPEIQARAIDDLVLDSGKKNIVKALCETYGDLKRKEHLFADMIKGKGEGQIMLLHGPPGTGKTLTAESVAEYTRRPLLSVTAADLGHETEKLEHRLLKFFRHAARWDAVLLLDEADVYLQRRSLHDLHRNGVVSGLLFITTNRVGTFDEAFMSRIHLQIGYDRLDGDAQTKVWEINLNRLEFGKRNGGRKFDVDWQVRKYVKTSPDLIKQNWNGREIRNAFQTAVALASFQAKQDGNDVPVLTPHHIDQVVSMSRNFKDYMSQALKATPEEFAAIHHLRADEYRDDQDAVNKFHNSK